MKVYLLWQIYHSADGQEPSDEVVRVYSTREKAEEHQETWPIKNGLYDYSSYYYIEEASVT